jgi:hypothetical protein
MFFSLATALSAMPAYSAAQVPADDDRQTAYRQRPTFEGSELTPVRSEEVEPGLAYNYYSRRLGRRTWGLAREDGTFQYAFGEGTMLPKDRFDLTPEEEVRLLQAGGDGLQQESPAAMIGADGQWRLLNFHVAPRVFDVETGHRWEWHGNRRAAVVHTFGDLWQVAGGRYVPLGGGGRFAFAPVDCSGLTRAGSAMFLTRTGEPMR